MTYYTRSALARYNLARAEAINSELAAIEAGFAKLPVDPLLATGAATWATAAGGPNAYTLTLPVTPTAYADGMRIVFAATAANTSGLTVDVNGLGVKSVVANGTGALIAADEIIAGAVLEIVYSGGLFRLLEKVTTVLSGDQAPGIPIDLATVSSPIAVAAGSVVTATGNANGDKVFVVADGAYEGQETEFFILGDPNGNTIDINDSGGGELVGNAASGSSHVIVWSGSASTYATGSTTAPLGALAVLDTVAEGSVTVNAAGFPFSADNQAQMNAGLRDAIAGAGGGISSVSDNLVSVGNGTTIVNETHGIQQPDGTALDDRVCVLRESVSQTTMTVTLSENLTRKVLFITAEDQDATVTIQRAGSDTINGETEVTITGGNKAVTIIPTGATTFSAIGAIDGARDLDGDLSADDFTISRAVLKDTAEAVNALGNQSGAIVLDYEDGQNVTLTLVGNATSLTINNWPASGTEGWMKITIDHGSGPYTWVDPANTRWPDGAGPTLSDGANEISIVLYTTANAGTIVDGWFGGQDRS